MTSRKRVFIGTAWPYANGSLHFGHVASLIGGDILARYHRQRGDEVLFVSGSDCHGTPIAVEAIKQGVKPEEISSHYHEEFTHNLIDGLGFSYDLYTKTTTPFHKKTVQDIFLQLHRKELIYSKPQNLPFCPSCNRFLPDRYIEGECPKCGFSPARGDQCDNCGNLLDPIQLVNPVCKICGKTPEWRESEHFFLKLSAFTDRLHEFVASQSESWRLNAAKFTAGLLKEGLIDRAITRDTDWGVEVPLAGYENKRIYVWFEAVCGYFSASKEWAELKGQPDDWKSYWQEECWHYYVHGKDNIPFHTIIWPAILIGYGGLNLPNQIVSSEFLNLEGRQFSKSRKWAAWIPDFLRSFNSESLRYYLIASGPETSDSSFSWKEFQSRNNNELIGTFGNFIHRVLSFIQRDFGGVVPRTSQDTGSSHLLTEVNHAYTQVGKLIEGAKFREALREVFRLAEEGNRDINKTAPWVKIRAGKKEEAGDVLGAYVQVIDNLRVLCSPFLPKTGQSLAKILGSTDFNWNIKEPLSDKKIQQPIPLFNKIEDDVIRAEIERLGK